MKSIDWIMKDTNARNIAVDQKFCKQACTFMGDADNNYDFICQKFFAEIQGFKSSVTQRNVRKRQIHRIDYVPTVKVI
jgi:hypothetical protein